MLSPAFLTAALLIPHISAQNRAIKLSGGKCGFTFPSATIISQTTGVSINTCGIACTANPNCVAIAYPFDSAHTCILISDLDQATTGSQCYYPAYNCEAGQISLVTACFTCPEGSTPDLSANTCICPSGTTYDASSNLCQTLQTRYKITGFDTDGLGSSVPRYTNTEEACRIACAGSNLCASGTWSELGGCRLYSSASILVPKAGTDSFIKCDPASQSFSGGLCQTCADDTAPATLLDSCILPALSLDVPSGDYPINQNLVVIGSSNTYLADGTSASYSLSTEGGLPISIPAAVSGNQISALNLNSYSEPLSIGERQVTLVVGSLTSDPANYNLIAPIDYAQIVDPANGAIVRAGPIQFTFTSPPNYDFPVYIAFTHGGVVVYNETAAVDPVSGGGQIILFSSDNPPEAEDYSIVLTQNGMDSPDAYTLAITDVGPSQGARQRIWAIIGS